MTDNPGEQARPFALAALFYAALALAVTFPLVLHVNSAVPHDLGDPLLSTSLLWWNAHVLPLTERWWNGFAFFPATGMVAFSDHRLGVSLLATPLQWLGCGPIAAANIAFLATFPLCALAGHVLAYTLTKRHDAAVLCGLAYGFNPFRVAHLPHLELLAAFGMPAALAALHIFVRERRMKWIGAFAAALFIQALCASYYMLFFSVLLTLWVLWFVRLREWRTAVAIAAGCACAAALLSPLAIGYWRIHQHYGFSRGFYEVTVFSADVTSLVTASALLPLWRWTAALNPGPERQIFPGLTIAVLAAIGLATALWRHVPTDNRWRLTSTLLLLVAVVYAAIAVAAEVIGPWKLSVAGLSVQATVPFKPISVAFAALVCSLALRPWARAAWRGRSTLAFYLVAAGLLFLCSFGPEPTFLGRTILYKPPYAWLMYLPLFADEVRAPARFAMPAILALSVAGALAFNRLKLDERRRRAVLILAMAGIIADGWVGHLELPSPGETWPVPRDRHFGSVLELPFGEGAGEFLAMYRTTLHGHSTVNGASGYYPPHYTPLQLAFKENDSSVFDLLTESEPLLVVVDKQADSSGRSEALVRTVSRATVVSVDDRWAIFEIGLSPHEPACQGSELRIAEARDARGRMDATVFSDHDASTWWMTKEAQPAGDTLLVDLGSPARVCAVRLAVFTSLPVYPYPRFLTVTTSVDANAWNTAFAGSTAGLAARGALEQPRDLWINVPLRSEAARFIRLRLEKTHEPAPWFIPEMRVIGSPP